MRKAAVTFAVIVIVLGLSGISDFAEQPPQEVYDLANTTLASLGRSSMIIAAARNRLPSQKLTPCSSSFITLFSWIVDQTQ